MLKFGFNLWICQKVNKVVEVEAKGQGGRRGGVGGIQGVDDVAAEEARIICILFESNIGKDLAYLVLPMLWATSQAV
jgi:hypothetical protein